MEGRLWDMRALSFGLIVLAGGAAAAPARPVAGVAIKVKGEALLDGKPLKESAFVYAGSVIETRAGACAALAMVSGAEVRFNERSEGRLEGGSGRQAASVALQAGQLWAHVLHGKSGLQVQGPHAAVTVRAAQADVAVGSRTVVKVYEGSAEVSNDAGRQSVAAMQQTQVGGPHEAPHTPTPLLPKAVESWQSGCAAIDRTAPPPPGTSRSSTLRLHRKPARTAPTKPAGSTGP